ncbi:MAG: cation-translocating P-type ATPase [Gammaproteobacteria bacterium]|nr:cation-translocating P-type ATPase [Gammaproteobacteria bacterium]
MTVSTISISDMHCAACANKIRSALTLLDGVSATHVNAARRQVLVEHSESTNPTHILQHIEEVGFSPRLSGADPSDHAQRALLKRLGIAGLAMMQVMMAAIAMYAGAFDGMQDMYRRLLELSSLVFCIPVVTYSAMPFFRSALGALRTGINMDVPIAAAIGIAFSASLLATISGSGEVYYDSVVMFTFLLLGARYIDDRLKQRFTASSDRLAALPAFGLRMAGRTRERVRLSDITIGDRIWVETGDQIPVDGRLDSASATLDESILTGESAWVERDRGDRVFAGTINSGPGFAVRTDTAFDGSRICDIAALADRAQTANPPITQLTDNIARYFVPAILLIAAATTLAWMSIDPTRALGAGLAVLVVSCPCALSLATPAALTAAMTRLRQAGVVLTRSDLLEQIPKLSCALIDKTGTLTVHQPRLNAITLLDVEAPPSARDTYLDLAAALQQFSNHPLARAFPAPQSATIDSPEIVPGAGVSGTWHDKRVRIGRNNFTDASVSSSDEVPDDQDIYLSIDDQAVARFTISDPLRQDAGAALAALQALDVPTTMLSGDSEARCAALASELSIDYISRQDPETKLRVTRELQQRGERVLMVGDGVNDVPALAAADISAVVVESNDLVKSKADVLLLSRRLGTLVDLVNVGRKTYRVIAQNLSWALGYNLVAIPLAACGFVPPWIAALGMASSSTLVMLNATRLLKVPEFDAGATRPPTQIMETG